ncbi:hypothetical protein ACFHW2_29560 [Actinomadura sp. LOL_016]|uniref:hypothetical protein n=1 Tax=unclassified Actinomadura TaxID=2626254 RepID=UPI003A7FADF7
MDNADRDELSCFEGEDVSRLDRRLEHDGAGLRGLTDDAPYAQRAVPVALWDHICGHRFLINPMSPTRVTPTAMLIERLTSFII